MEAAKPRIGIPVPTSFDLEYNTRSWRQYAAAVSEAGGEPVEIALGREERQLREVAGGCDGFCLTGSPADVDPVRYGAEREPATAPADVQRESADFLLLDHAERLLKPVLGVCYGAQSMNVWAGGTLVQDLHPVPVNHSAGSRVAVAHAAQVVETSQLGAMLEEEEAPLNNGFLRLPVNTSHHQAVASPGDGFRVVARCPDDGVIEAIEKTGGDFGSRVWMLGVQWHPERSVAISGASRALFRQLVQEARAYQVHAEARVR